MNQKGDDGPGKNKERKPSFFSIRDSLPTMEAVRNYDKYVTEHTKRLRQLERLAAGDMTPGDLWYDE